MKKGFLYFVTAILLFSITGCEKDDEQITSYIGKWTSTYTEDGMTIKEELVLTETSYEDIMKVPTTTGAYLDFMGIKGAMSVSGNKLTLTASSIGMAEIDWEALTIGAFSWYDKGTDEYAALIEDFGGDNMKGEFEVTGEVMILKLDVDGDEAYSEDEITTYTKM